MNDKDAQPVTDLNELVKAEVSMQVGRYVEESNNKHDKTYEAVLRVEKLVKQTSGGGWQIVYAFVQSAATAVLAFFTFRHN